MVHYKFVILVLLTALINSLFYQVDESDELSNIKIYLLLSLFKLLFQTNLINEKSYLTRRLDYYQGKKI